MIGKPIPSDIVSNPFPTGIAVSFDNSTLYVNNSSSQHLVSFSFSNPDIPTLTSFVVLPTNSTSLAVTPDNKKIYLNNSRISSTEIFVYHLPLNGQTMPDKTITIPSGQPEGMAISRDGTRLYVACFGNPMTNQIGVVDIATDTLIQMISINQVKRLRDIIITPDDKFLYVVNTGTIAVGRACLIDITDPANPIVVNNINAGGAGPNFLSITPDQAPLADFTFAVTAPLTVSFDASDSVSPVGSIATYAWDFGDATTESGVTVSHTYAIPGTFTVTLTVTNTAGTSTNIIFPVGQTVLNDGGPSARQTQMITVPAACPPTPSIPTISPTSGPEGTEVTITGTDLTEIQEVFFGNVSGEILSQNGTSLVVVAPAGIAAGTTVTVSVLACNGTTVNGPNFSFTSFCPPTPTITNISPTSGPAGTVVTITGTNLTDIQEVFFGAVPGLIVNQTGTTLDVTAPAGIAVGTTVAVSVLACSGENVIGPNFLFTSSCPPTPTITSLSPTSGAPCTIVTINGTNLNDIQAVFFGGVPGTIVSQNGSSLVVNAPAGIAAGASVAVSVLACNGSTVTGPSFLFTRSCSPTPTITNISPASGPTGTLVTITGKNLTEIQEVFFGEVPGGIVKQSGTSLVAIAPSGIAPGISVAVIVLDCEGTTVTGPNFLFTSSCPPTPTITNISPTSGSAGTVVTITGTNLTDIQEVFFGTVPGGIVSQSGTSLVVIAPPGIAPSTSVALSVLACNGTSVTGPNFLFTSSCPPTPTITNISPTSGPAGTVVTITGTNLTDIQEVFFGTVPGGIVNQTGASLVVIAPSGIAPGTSVVLSILACNGTSVTGPTFLFISEVSNLVCPPRDVVGKQKKCHSKVVNVITWKAPERGCGSEQPITYRIYRDAALTDLIATVPVHSNQRRFRFQDRSASRERATYFIVSVDSLGNQSPASSVTIVPKRKHERHHSS